jgi:hypothetical protein
MQSQTFYFGGIERIMAQRGEEKIRSEPESRRGEEQQKVRRAADTRSAARSAGSGLPGPARTGPLNPLRLLPPSLRDPVRLPRFPVSRPAFYRSVSLDATGSILSLSFRLCRPMA